jgi:hypothetical protein
MKQTANILNAVAELCAAMAEEEVTNDDRHAELNGEIRDLQQGQARLFLDQQKTASDIGKLAAHVISIPLATAQAITRELSPQTFETDSGPYQRLPLTESDKLDVTCAACGFKAEIPCRANTHFYSERAEVAAGAGWGVAVIPGDAVLYFCPADSKPEPMAAVFARRG